MWAISVRQMVLLVNQLHDMIILIIFGYGFSQYNMLSTKINTI